MSYCRFGEADAYIYDDCAGYTCCCWCAMNGGQSVRLYTLDEAVAHVAAHRAAGHHIPGDVEDEMRSAEAEDSSWRAARITAEGARMTDATIDTLQGLPDVTRFEIIDEEGRVYVADGVSVLLSVQDQGRTLKVYVR